MMKHFWLGVSGSLFLLVSGCALRPYHMQIEQGSQINTAQVNALQAGMTQDQVSYILGTPNLIDPYHPKLWYYIYTSQENYGKLTHNELVVRFNDAGLVADFHNQVSAS